MPVKAKKFRVKVSYGSVDVQTKIFQPLHISIKKGEQLTDDVFETATLNTYSNFAKKDGANSIRVEVYEANSLSKRICEAICDLQHLRRGRFAS